MKYLLLKIRIDKSHEDWEVDQQRHRESLLVNSWTSPVWTLLQVLCAFFH